MLKHVSLLFRNLEASGLAILDYLALEAVVFLSIGTLHIMHYVFRVAMHKMSLRRSSAG